jgi:hypothetical protein
MIMNRMHVLLKFDRRPRGGRPLVPALIHTTNGPVRNRQTAWIKLREVVTGAGQAS